MATVRLVLFLAGTSMLWSTAFAGTVLVPGLGGGIQIDVESYQDQRFSTIMRQQYDYSCGSAAVASLLSYHYNDPISEADVFRGMFALADPDKVRREGFSMLDMKRYLESRGYRADGFRLPIEMMREKVALPAIALVTLDGFRHFVVIKGISDQEVYVGDPTRGLRVYSKAQFLEFWDGTAFVIRNHVALGRETFNRDGSWPQYVRAPLSTRPDGPSLGHTLPYWPTPREW